jgi:hypothetical protein
MKRELYNKIGRGRFVLFPIMAIAFLTLISYLVMQLWNNILPEVMNVQSINIWQAAGIFILCKILFGFGRMGGFGKDKMMFKQRLAERVKDMSPEELAQFEKGFEGQRFRRFNMCRPEEQKESQ